MPRPQAGSDGEDLQVEASLQFADLSLQFVGLPQEIIKILQNKFKLINLYRLRHMQGLTFEAYQDKERIGIEDGILKLRKTSGTCKDYGSNYYELSSTPPQS